MTPGVRGRDCTEDSVRNRLQVMDTRQLTAITDEHVRRFSDDGYLVIDRIADDDDLALLRELYDKVLTREIDCGPADRLLGGITRQVTSPEKTDARFRENPVVPRIVDAAT